MLSEIILIGRPTTDPEVQMSRSGKNFVRLDMAVNKSFGDKAHVNYYRAWFQGEHIEQITKAGVKKGSLIYITGDLDVKSFTRKDGSQGQSLDINVSGWGFASTKSQTATEGKPAANGAQPTAPANGEYNPYTPAQNAPQFEELGADDDLPF